MVEARRSSRVVLPRAKQQRLSPNLLVNLRAYDTKFDVDVAYLLSRAAADSRHRART